VRIHFSRATTFTVAVALLFFGAPAFGATKPAAQAVQPGPAIYVESAPSKPDDKPTENSVEYYKALAEYESKVSAAAIQSSKDAVDRIKDLLTVFSIFIGTGVAIASFFGIKEYIAWKRIYRNTKATADRIGNILVRVAAKRQEMEKMEEESRTKHLELQKIQFEMLSLRFSFEQYYAHSRKSPNVDEAHLIAQLRALYGSTKGIGDAERVFSWSAATLAVMLSDAGRHDEALAIGEEAYATNPQRFADRAFNLACFASLLWKKDRTDTSLRRCAEWLAKAIAEAPTAKADVVEEEDFAETRDQPTIAALIAG
jgi:hypothetical protein